MQIYYECQIKSYIGVPISLQKYSLILSGLEAHFIYQSMFGSVIEARIFSWALFFKEKYIIVNIDTPNIENVLDLMHVILIQKVDWFRKFKSTSRPTIHIISRSYDILNQEKKTFFRAQGNPVPTILWHSLC